MATLNRNTIDRVQDGRRSTRIAQVTDELRRRIAAGEWAVGDRIPTEPELVELLDASRNTLREAVGALVHAGVLERRQGSGTYVLAVDEQEVALGDYFSSARRRDLIELREALDVTAADLAARRRDEDDIAMLRELLARRNDLWDRPAATSADERDEIVDADAQLHRAIVVASHNEIYLEFYDLLLPALRRTIAERPVGASSSYEEQHTALVEAVIDGDPLRAAGAAQEVLDCVRDAEG
ncbi:putative GntR family transcriptional regulator [Gordonia araii NBRC 100433]|uniref:Putative GntR family transcriptional regulator n=1 Tax=Gordonia araii NBRC 100433 TaxID=1073574 RepID=G7H3U0_9ACTN|nr:FCD domain-containing protein [Gordonia araii]NNG98664.1 FadR family transcriptional regulator [Gordonia araii NBRC 100433]GAB10515.1 putative GntR family transcriptional regulator [Gordonia araii NBRC 100433]